LISVIGCHSARTQVQALAWYPIAWLRDPVDGQLLLDTIAWALPQEGGRQFQARLQDYPGFAGKPKSRNKR
jgi:hypothetical protein